VRIVIAREEFVNNHSLVNQIDTKRAASKCPLLILQILRRTYDGGNAVRAEMLLQKNELTRRRQVFPIQDRNVRHAGAAPFAKSAQQRFQQHFNRRELAQTITSGKARHDRQLEEQSIQFLLIRQTRRILGVGFYKFNFVAVKERVEPSRYACCRKSRINQRHIALSLC
jgi:hypothetical protein